MEAQLTATVRHPMRDGSRWRKFVSVAGPGLVVMLADTDAGSVITAAQSGAQWGYRLLLLQAILIPILFIVQELTVRLGIVTRQGHGRGIKEHFGPVWAWISVATLLVACTGALVTELSGVASVGALFGIPAWASMVAVVTGLVTMTLLGTYATVERIALAIGLFELVFLFVAWDSHPDFATMAAGAVDVPYADPKYLYLAAANVGAVIMPWMVFYQQSSVAEKGLTLSDLRAARIDTAIGAVVTQVIMAAVLIATAGTLGRARSGRSLDSVEQIAQAITPFLGRHVGTIVFAMGMLGASLVATIVVTLTASRTLGEILGFKHSLHHSAQDAPAFYGVYAAVLVAGGVLVASGVNLVRLSVAVQVMNAFLLPIVLGFLFMLARRTLPAPYRLEGTYAWVAGITIAATAAFGLYAGLWGGLT